MKDSPIKTALIETYKEMQTENYKYYHSGYLYDTAGDIHEDWSLEKAREKWDKINRSLK